MEIAKIFNWDTQDISKSYISSSDIQHEKFNLPSDEICFDNIDHEIITRPKHQKLTKDQLFYLKSIINTSKLSISEISCKYDIWPTTLRKIKHLSLEELSHHLIKNFKALDFKNKQIIENEVMKFYNKSSNTFTSKDVQKYLIENSNVVLPLNKLVWIMKNDLNLPYKRYLSRPNYIDLERIKL